MVKQFIKKDITGQRFGSLVALAVNEDLSQKGKTVWHCRCDCGNETDVLIGSLISGNTQSCGKHEHPTKDITGQLFGKLTALYPTGEKKNRRAVWRCRCECSNERDVVITRLTIGQAKACEQCSKIRPFVDLTGQRFGSLVVIGPSAEKRGGGKNWLCQCDCGNTKVAFTHHLTQGGVISCGCILHEPKDIIGEKRGHLTCLRFTGKRDRQGSAIYEWQCDCGNIVERAIRGTLGPNKNPQCPECQKKVKHGQAVTSRSRIIKDPDTGVSLTALNNIIVGKPTATNSSGVRGVYWSRSKKKWEVSGRENGKPLYLGSYDTLEEAKAVREVHVRRVYGSNNSTTEGADSCDQSSIDR